MPFKKPALWFLQTPSFIVPHKSDQGINQCTFLCRIMGKKIKHCSDSNKCCFYCKPTIPVLSFPLSMLLIIQDLFNMWWEGQIYSLLISSYQAQSKSLFLSDILKSSQCTEVTLFFSLSSLCVLLVNVIGCYTVKFTQFYFT